MRDYNKLFKHGNRAQKEKLDQNSHKKGFDKISYRESYRRLTDELCELSEEIFCKNPDPKKIRHEAADIANFAHMIILNCDNILGD